MTREICFFYEKGLNDAEAVVYGTPAFDLLFNKILACCLRHRDFSVWMHINYETTICGHAFPRCLRSFVWKQK